MNPPPECLACCLVAVGEHRDISQSHAGPNIGDRVYITRQHTIPIVVYPRGLNACGYGGGSVILALGHYRVERRLAEKKGLEGV